MYNVVSMIPAAARNAVLAKIEKIAARMSKNGLEVPYIVSEEDAVCKNNEGKLEAYIKFTFAVPQVKSLGFQIVGRIENLADDTNGILNMVTMYDGMLSRPEYMNHISKCHHCGVNRDRNVYYIVKNEDDIEMLVGSTCVEAMCGIPQNYMNQYHFMKTEIYNLEEEFEGVGGVSVYPLDAIVSFAIEEIEKGGFVPKAAEYEYGATSTSTKVKRRVENTIDLTVSEEMKSKVQYAIALAQSVPMVNNFDQKYVAVATQEMITYNRFSFACLIANAFIRDQENQNRKPSNWVGKEKERIKGVEVTVAKRYVGVGFNGPFYVITYEDNEGNVLTWTTNTDPNHNKGDKMVIDFTVKGHDTYKEIKQTKILRVKKH